LLSRHFNRLNISVFYSSYKFGKINHLYRDKNPHICVLKSFFSIIIKYLLMFQIFIRYNDNIYL